MQICRLYITHHIKVGDICEKLCVKEIGVVYIAAYSHNVGIILPYEPCFQDGHSLVGRLNVKVNIIVGSIEPLLYFLESLYSLGLVLDHSDVYFSVGAFARSAALQKKR